MGYTVGRLVDRLVDRLADRLAGRDNTVERDWKVGNIPDMMDRVGKAGIQEVGNGVPHKALRWE